MGFLSSRKKQVTRYKTLVAEENPLKLITQDSNALKDWNRIFLIMQPESVAISARVK